MSRCKSPGTIAVLGDAMVRACDVCQVEFEWYTSIDFPDVACPGCGAVYEMLCADWEGRAVWELDLREHDDDARPDA